jgi:mRNA interferase RelE/StbE
MTKTYSVEYSKRAQKDIAKLDVFQRKLILSWINNNLEQCDNPRQHGKSLVGDRSGEWRYRVGDYRIIAEIQSDRIVILVLRVNHRKEVYGRN